MLTLMDGTHAAHTHTHTQIYKTQTQFKDRPAGERRGQEGLGGHVCRGAGAQVSESQVENEDVCFS